MICRHCGKEYSDEFAYCPYCAEPTVKLESFQETHISEEEQMNRASRGADGHYFLITFVVGALWFVFGYLICQFLGWAIYPETLGNDAFHDKADTFAIFSWFGLLIGWILFRWLNIKSSNENKKAKRVKRYIINKQYINNPTSICPKCGSHNIKVYRKGYNYKVGFWGSIFGVRGAGYAGGFDANTACCRCMNCGHDWETDYDYRLINK